MDDRSLLRELHHAAGLTRRRPENENEPGCARGRRGSGRILEALSEKEGRSQKDLAEKLDIRPQSVSEAVGRMEEEGWILRRPDPGDGRGVLVFLTEKGARRREEVRREKEALAKRFFAVLNQSEKETLFSLLQKINGAFDAGKGGEV